MSTRHCNTGPLSNSLGDNHDMFVFLPYNTAQFASLKANLNYYSFTAALNSMVTKVSCHGNIGGHSGIANNNDINTLI